MVATITPVGHGGRRVGWAASVALHAAGAGLSAAVVGGALGAVGLLLGAPWGTGGLLLVGLVALGYAGRELLGIRIPLPEARRQVPEWWRTSFPPAVTAMLYGVGLGIGFLTHLRHGTLAAVGAAGFATGDPLLGAALMAPFGLARGLAVATAAGARSPQGVGRVVARLEGLGASRWPRIVNGAALLTIAAAALVVGRDGAGDIGAPAAAVVALAFGWAALAKALRPRTWRRALRGHVEGPWEPAASLGVPAAEALVAGLVVAGRPSMAGTLALSLLAVFSLATLRARRTHGDRVPCGCFGRARAVDYRIALVRNLALGAAAALAVGAEGAVGIPIRPPAGQDVLPAALTVTGIAVAVWAVARSVRWLGRGAAR